MIGVTVLLLSIKLAVALNSDGFCTSIETYKERVTYIETYRVSVPFTKKCRYVTYRTCYDYREEKKSQLASRDVLKTRIVKKCCQGYRQEDSKCMPICSASCINGTCTAPETCTCNKGFHKNDQQICVENECDPDRVDGNECPDGTCTPNGQCVCNKGFERKLSDASVKFKCVPICTQGCANGTCALPDKCVCNSGYESFNSSVCIPICEKGCMFGTCTDPEICTCFEGYQLQKGSQNICDPVCSSGCLNGVCVGPDECACNSGFDLNTESKECEPFCEEGCVNSKCTAPNTCTCDIGFLPSNVTHCVVPCENCTNGYCEEPNVCQCEIDYHLDNGTCVEDECSSVDNNCENGVCSNGTCECHSGYIKDASEVAVCSPVCSLQCINGYCTEPDVCQCIDGFEIVAKNVGAVGNCSNCTLQWNVCSAICVDCQNGTCNEGVCNCSEGYEHDSSNKGKCVITQLVDDSNNEFYKDRVVTYMKSYKVSVPITKKCSPDTPKPCVEYTNKIQQQVASRDVLKTRIVKKCCQGYRQEDSKCIPICSASCINGICTAPETCTCNKGFHKNDQQICVENECDPDRVNGKECPDGTCTPNGQCACNKGFERKLSDSTSSTNSGYESFNSSVCVPICEKGCMFGTCTDPEICTCFEGHQLRKGSHHICDPVCSSGCLNGVCVSPDECVCNSGFSLNEESKECRPFCEEECINSKCTAPNTCTCDIGYLPFNVTHCIVPCENCTNGYCEEANVCQCEIDYHLRSGVCVENECSGVGDSCENGVCWNGSCECNSGYMKDTSTVQMYESSNKGKCVITQLVDDSKNDLTIIILAFLVVVSIGVIGGLAYCGSRVWRSKISDRRVAYSTEEEATVLL
ncbi:Epidermal growth factor-like protein [Pseudolycoriella hygida]|uniref:Epidermal growth factor-like protein n=1 Tax=Pseudolycoriella hygida TaxID=35572 RepID=A0A9Q0S5J5_9DIPT|nr:Epidermal growth factor-like protein [Pseudolycoriella hygida]